MLKKITAAVCVIAMVLVILSGCSFMYKNEQRDADQYVAVVRYGGRVSYVTKGELSLLFNQQGYIYMYYYGWTAERTFTELSRSLANNALLALKAKEYLSNLESINLTDSTVGIEKPTTDQLILEMEQLLTDKQIMEAKNAANDSFRSAFDDLVKEIEEEKQQDNPNEDEDEDEEEEEEEFIRPRPPVDEEDQDIIIPSDFFTLIDTEIANMTGLEKEIAREALRRLKRSLNKQNRDYNFYYKNQLTTKVIERYREEFKAELDDPTEADIINRYNEILAKNIQDFVKKDGYKSALEANPKSVIYHPGYDIAEEKGYFFVKNILLAFSDEQAKALSDFKAEKVATEEAIKAYRDYLASQILVNVSNIEYDPDKPKGDDNKVYIKEDIPMLTILSEIYQDLTAAESIEDIIKVFIDWTYLVNDDPGMFSVLAEGKPDYLVPPEGINSPYVDEFTELARELFLLGEGAYTTLEGELSYAVTDFGIHLILVTYIPFNYAEKQGGDEIVISNDMNLLTLDAVIDPATGQTLREYIFDILKEENADNAMSAANKEFYQEYKDTAVTYYPKVYRDLMKKAKELER